MAWVPAPFADNSASAKGSDVLKKTPGCSNCYKPWATAKAKVKGPRLVLTHPGFMSLRRRGRFRSRRGPFTCSAWACAPMSFRVLACVSPRAFARSREQVSGRANPGSVLGDGFACLRTCGLGRRPDSQGFAPGVGPDTYGPSPGPERAVACLPGPGGLVRGVTGHSR